MEILHDYIDNSNLPQECRGLQVADFRQIHTLGSDSISISALHKNPHPSEVSLLCRWLIHFDESTTRIPYRHESRLIPYMHQKTHKHDPNPDPL